MDYSHLDNAYIWTTVVMSHTCMTSIAYCCQKYHDNWYLKCLQNVNRCPVCLYLSRNGNQSYAY